MNSWQAQLRLDLQRAISEAGIHPSRRAFANPPTLHLAILTEPYLRWVLCGRKTIESRFSVNRVPPYGVVNPGDFLILKRAAGPIIGLCEAADVEFFELDRSTRSRIRARYGSALCAEDPEFWKARERASYATLIHLGEVHRLPPLACRKRDRRGWVVIPGASFGTQIALPSNWARRPDRQWEV